MRVPLCVLLAVVLVGAAAPARAEPVPVEPGFVSMVTAVPDDVAAQMRAMSWRPGCPVPIEDLRLVQVSHVGGTDRVGALVVHADVAEATVRIFRTLHEARFPIRSMYRIEAYGGSDDASMAAGN